MNHILNISSQLGIPTSKVSAAIELFDAENTIPFIARYRKEATGSLDEEQLRDIQNLHVKLRSLDERRQTVLKSIDEQGKLTAELQEQIMQAATMTALEDLYQPYKPKRRTRAMIARERGLQPLAELILSQAQLSQGLDQIAAPFLSEAITNLDEAWAGACDIVAETISDHPDVRRITREKAFTWGSLRCEKIEDAQDASKVYELYYDFEGRIDRIKPYQVLAINRGEAEKVLHVKVVVSERDWRGAMQAVFREHPRSPLAGKLREAMDDAADRLLLPAIDRDVRRTLGETAETHAINVFAVNLRALLNQPPLVGHTVLGIDPGFRTGSKVAVIDQTGKLLETKTIYPHEPQKRWEESLTILQEFVERYHVTLITIGNGTASRETEKLAAALIQRMAKSDDELHSMGLHYLIVNEAGASVYSASPLARAEFPDLDVSLRGAVSIARRAQDPLAELVKIDPRSIGVGLYQHDVEQKNLSESLTGVVESVVNQVGVDVNTASPALLTYVSGIGPKLAEQIVAYRENLGEFSDRKQLLKVPKLGPKAFEQAAGFLRIRDGNNPLDASAIHPESYSVAIAVLKKVGLTASEPVDVRKSAIDSFREKQDLKVISEELGAGLPTLVDILEQLVRPGRDPRQDLPAPILRSDILSMEDLAVGMRMKGTVRNVVDFGAFVDIGVKQDGLLHRSQAPKDQSLKVGDIIDVEIQKLEIERGRIGLKWV